MNAWGKLYICGTPIGNLDDVTLRLLKVLDSVDVIAAEDTRRTGKLLNYYEINTSLTSYHEHNEQEKAVELMSLLRKGKKLALVSNAGMPGVSDPGCEIIKRAIAEDVEVIPVPGPTAAISALVVSGLPMDSFVFTGFLPRRGEERREKLQQIKQEQRTTIVYESPYRLLDTLQDLAQILAQRQLAVVRELTKVHEEKIYGTANEVLAEMKNREIKGEIVIVIAGREAAPAEKEGWEDLTILEHVELLMKNGYTKKRAIKEVANTRDLPKSEVYEIAIAIDARKYI